LGVNSKIPALEVVHEFLLLARILFQPRNVLLLLFTVEGSGFGEALICGVQVLEWGVQIFEGFIFL